jgi:hypothetical protein
MWLIYAGILVESILFLSVTNQNDNKTIIFFKVLHNYAYICCGVMQQLKVGNLWALQRVNDSDC